MQQVFVFGTLKEGFPNFSTNKGRRVPGDFTTKSSYPLYLIGERNSPWLVLDEGKGHPVKGQVFEVSDETLADIDRLERITKPDGYRRIMLEVVCKQTGEASQVFVYCKPKIQLQNMLIQQELAGDYTLEHAKLYTPRSIEAVATP
ncbi:gamma-glutamylcyclotransferase [Vibrio sp. T187]|uniref:gamma-glutamylcyclotransferase family protein n=1 Tax=Vibrio TaxID=662 RepID=UPI0010C9B83E|nr:MULTISPECIES: gamma-glutamylcyclotransferase family protein [Vibrio]MBW3695194.1 gamma-glutamylcyclotransferase [Vibrio sp. T187]